VPTPVISRISGQGTRQVDEEAGQEGGDLVEGQPGLLDHPVGDAAVDADRGEAARLRAVDHHEPHQERADLVLHGEAERDRGDDGDGAWADRSDRGEHRGEANMIHGIAPIRPRTARTASSTSQSTVPLSGRPRTGR
jgi:hypothetical protein